MTTKDVAKYIYLYLSDIYKFSDEQLKIDYSEKNNELSDLVFLIYRHDIIVIRPKKERAPSFDMRSMNYDEEFKKYFSDPILRKLNEKDWPKEYGKYKNLRVRLVDVHPDKWIMRIEDTYYGETFLVDFMLLKDFEQYSQDEEEFYSKAVFLDK